MSEVYEEVWGGDWCALAGYKTIVSADALRDALTAWWDGAS